VPREEREAREALPAAALTFSGLRLFSATDSDEIDEIF
jgi:hypothetical protein